MEVWSCQCVTNGKRNKGSSATEPGVVSQLSSEGEDRSGGCSCFWRGAVGCLRSLKQRCQTLVLSSFQQLRETLGCASLAAVIAGCFILDNGVGPDLLPALSERWVSVR